MKLSKQTGQVKIVKQNPQKFLDKKFYMIDHRYNLPIQVTVDGIANYKIGNGLFGLLGVTNAGTRVIVSEFELYRFAFTAKWAMFKNDFKESIGSRYHIKSKLKRKLISFIENF